MRRILIAAVVMFSAIITLRLMRFHLVDNTRDKPVDRVPPQFARDVGGYFGK